MITQNKVEIVNCMMLVLSIIAACFLPFETFLFSYAVLGPLHYLTELQWLNKKDFFIPKTKTLMFVILSTLTTVLLFLNYYIFFIQKTEILVGVILSSFFALCFSFILLVNSNRARIFIVGFILLLGILYFVKPVLIIMLGLFLPTIIHVYVFTFFFMIVGYLKFPNRFALMGILMLISVPLLIYFFPLENLIKSNFSSQKIYNSTGFKIINDWLAIIFGDNKEANTIIILKAQIFIAFAYTYHYLNWFSKTSVIGWAKTLELKKMILVLGIWILSIALYLYNYQTGLMVLFILSMIHVLAEFPLNVLSIKTIFQKLISK